MNIDKFRLFLLENGAFIIRDYPVENSQCFECNVMIIFYNEKTQDTLVSFNINTPPKSVAGRILYFLEQLPEANNLTVMDSHHRTNNGYVLIESEETMIDDREKNAIADNILLNTKGYDC